MNSRVGEDRNKIIIIDITIIFVISSSAGEAEWQSSAVNSHAGEDNSKIIIRYK